MKSAIVKPVSISIICSLVCASLPAPAFCAVPVQAHSGSGNMAGNVIALPANALNFATGNNALQTSVGRLSMTGTFNPLQTPTLINPGIMSVENTAPNAVGRLSITGTLNPLQTPALTNPGIVSGRNTAPNAAGSMKPEMIAASQAVERALAPAAMERRQKAAASAAGQDQGLVNWVSKMATSFNNGRTAQPLLDWTFDRRRAGPQDPLAVSARAGDSPVKRSAARLQAPASNMPDSTNSESRPSPAKPPQYQPRAAVRGLGIAAFFASILPIAWGVGQLISPNIASAFPWEAGTSAVLGSWVVPIVPLALGIPALIFGLRVMMRIDRLKYPIAPGDDHDGVPEFAGFLGGMGSWLFFPMLAELLTKGATSMPVNTLILGGIIAATILSFLGLHAVDRAKVASPNAFSKWMAFAGYAAGVSLMIGAAAAQSPLGILAGLAVMMSLFGISLFTGAIGKRIAAMARSIVDGARSHKLAMPAIKVSVRAGMIAGLLIGSILALGLSQFSLLFAFAPILGVLLGWHLTRKSA